jgi:hypothetical protein
MGRESHKRQDVCFTGTGQSRYERTRTTPKKPEVGTKAAAMLSLQPPIDTPGPCRALGSLQNLLAPCFSELPSQNPDGRFLNTLAASSSLVLEL